MTEQPSKFVETGPLSTSERLKILPKINSSRTHHRVTRSTILHPAAYFPPLGLEATNSELYDLLHKARYGNTTIIDPGPSRLSNSTKYPSYTSSVHAALESTNLVSHTMESHSGLTLHDQVSYISPNFVTNGEQPQSLNKSFPCSTNECNHSSTQSPLANTSLNRQKTFALQWNLNGFFNNLPDLELLVRNKQPAILALQEIHKVTALTMDNTLGKKYKWIAKVKSNLYHSVAVGVLAELPYSVIPLDTDLPIVAIRLSWPFPVSIASFYIPNGKIPNLHSQLTEIIKKLPDPVILLGDCNGHHHSWGSPKNNLRGSILADFANENGLTILNDGSVTFIKGQVESSIDVSLVSAHIVPRFLWTASTDPLGSDHVPITLELNDSTPATSRRPRWIFDRANWLGFQTSIDAALDQSPPDSISDFSKMITDSAPPFIPKTSSTPGRRALHWWSEDTKQSVKSRRKALRAAKRFPPGHPKREEAYQIYREKRNACRQIIRDAKEQSWTRFLDSINDQQSSSELWARFNALQGKRRVNGIALKIGNVTTRNPSTIANALADHFAELSSLRSYPDSFLKKHPSPEKAIQGFSVPPDKGQEFNQPFTLMELKFALNKCKGKSAGPDEIGYPMLKNLSIRGKHTLLELINKEWNANTLPKEWNHSLVIPIPKPGGNSTDPKNFRPIALTSCAAKVMEKMANRRLVQYLEGNNKLDQRQHAFRPGQGTGTYFATLGQVLDDAVSQGEHVEIAALDLAKACNRTWTPRVLNQLANWGVTGYRLSFT